jgi:ABC-type nitrate/sulfonate/bicarbonate transport system permease component
MKIRVFLGGSILLLIWIFISALSLVDTLFLATPWGVCATLYRLAVSGRLFMDIFFTLGRAAVSLVISMIIGIPLGLLIGLSTDLREWLELPIEFFRSLPAPAIFPVLMILLGIGEQAKIAGTIFACLFPIIVHTAYGVINGNRSRILLVKRMGFSDRNVLVKVVFPEALPYIFVGLRNALSLSLIATMVMEMLMTGQVGVGYSIFNAYQTFRIPEMYAYIFITGMLGWIINKLFVSFEHRQLHWVGH